MESEKYRYKNYILQYTVFVSTIILLILSKTNVISKGILTFFHIVCCLTTMYTVYKFDISSKRKIFIVLLFITSLVLSLL